MMERNQHIANWKKRKFFFFLIIPVILLLLAFAVMLLWNAILPSLLNISAINYWQSLGVLVLCRILFGGFRFGPRGDRPSFKGMQWREKWMQMNEEERLQFKEEWKKRCGEKK
jgi:hypothetical protein